MSLIGKKFGKFHVVSEYVSKYDNKRYVNLSYSIDGVIKRATTLYSNVNRLSSLQNKISNVFIIMHYEVEYFMGRGKETEIKNERAEEYAVITHGVGKSYNEQLDKAKAMLYRKIKDALYNGRILKYSFTDEIITANQLKANSQFPTRIPMKRAMPNGYAFIHGVDINKPKVEGQCVPEYLIKEYPKLKMTTKTLDKLMKSPLDDYIGYTVLDVQKFCDKYKISHYALDIRHSCFHKCVQPNFKGYALIYYMIDDHMYPVTDKKTRNSITRTQSEKVKKAEGNHNQFSISEKEQEELEKEQNELIDRFNLTEFEDVPIDKLDTYKDCNIYYHLGNLCDMVVDLFKTKRWQFEEKWSGSVVTRIKYYNNVWLLANPNHKSGKLDWNDSRLVCKQLDIPFTNQSITSVVLQHHSIKFNMKGGRICLRKALSQDLKNGIIEFQSNKCNCCHSKLHKYEIDHIIPPSQGGSNDLVNLQALCKSCHKTKTDCESSERRYKCDNTKSTFNVTTKEIFSDPKYGIIHNFGKVKKECIQQGLDMNKCRKNIVRYSEHKWCVFSILDDPVIFDKKKHNTIPAGAYYIITYNILPFKGNGWYFYPLIQYALTKKIIKLSDIKYYLKPSLTLSPEYFNDFIDSIVKNCPEHLKLGINSFLGSLGHKVSKNTKMYLTNSIDYASYLFFSCKKLCPATLVPGTDIWKVLEISEEKIDSSHVPIFHQVLDLEAMELHKTAEILRENGGEVIFANTDNVVANFPKDKKMIPAKWWNIFWDKDKKVRKYKELDEVTMPDRFISANTEEFVYTPPQYKIIKDVPDNDFTPLVKKIIEMNQSIQFQGGGGVGKTTLIKLIRKELEKMGKNVLCLAPTNKAAIEIGDAQTIDSFMCKFNGKSWGKATKYDWIIIDEKSMMRENFLSSFYSMKKQINCKIILAGDWNQLPPVCDRSSTFDYENSSCVWNICDGNKLLLTTCRRSDKQVYNLSLDVENIDTTKLGHKECKKSIAFRNVKRKQVNQSWMEKLAPKNCEILKKNEKNPNSQDTYIYAGLPIMACKTNRDSNIFNGMEFVVKNIKKAGISVVNRKTKEIILVARDIFTTIFFPAYCVTVHKSQGATYDEEYTIYEWNEFEKRMKYVAITRGTKIENINIVV